MSFLLLLFQYLLPVRKQLKIIVVANQNAELRDESFKYLITYIEISIRNSYIPSLIALQGFSGFTVEDPCVVASSGDLLAFSPGLTVFTVLEFVVIVPEPSPVTVSESDVVILPEPSVRSVATVLEFSVGTVPEPSVVTVSDS